MKRVLTLAIACFFTTTGTAVAQSDDKRTVYKPITEIDMGETDVNATVVKPVGVMVTENRRLQFNPMIKLRKDFDAEVDLSVDAVR